MSDEARNKADETQKDPAGETESQVAEGQAAPEQAAPEETSTTASSEGASDGVSPELAFEALQMEIASLKDQVLRLAAELENSRKRAQRDKEDSLKYAAGPLARDLLPVADNLARALASVPDEALASNTLLQSITDGVRMTEKILSEALAKHRITRLQPLGERLDPHLHEAMAEVPNDQVASGHILEVLEPGYLLQDRLLRPARVIVARAPAASTAEKEEEVKG